MLFEQNGTIQKSLVDAQSVVQCLEAAGRALLSLPNSGPSTRLVQSGLEWIRDASEQAAGSSRGRIRPATPDAATISRMDQALAWIPLIPIDRYVLRRIVGARSLVDPMTARHLYSWRRLGTAIGADHKAVQRWHAQGIDLIVAALTHTQRKTAPQPGLPSRRVDFRSERAVRPDATVRS